jgi:uncharacterized membrane protein
MSAAVVTQESLPDQSARAHRRAIAVWLGATLISVTILGMIVAAPIAQAHGYSQFASSLYQAFSFVCHQIPERSFHLDGHKFAVCSRCTGLYTGFAVAALIYPFARSLRRTDTPALRWLILATAPLVIDFALGYFSIWQNTHLSRFLTGALLSSVAVFYIMPGLVDLISARVTTNKKIADS